MNNHGKQARSLTRIEPRGLLRNPAVWAAGHGGVLNDRGGEPPEHSPWGKPPTTRSVVPQPRRRAPTTRRRVGAVSQSHCAAVAGRAAQSPGGLIRSGGGGCGVSLCRALAGGRGHGDDAGRRRGTVDCDRAGAGAGIGGAVDMVGTLPPGKGGSAQ